MARTVNEEAYIIRRNAILDAAQRAIATKGYEQMTIADLLNDLQISSGAFYHYFDSKPAVLEALVQRTGDQAKQLVIPIVNNPTLSALEKLKEFFATLDRSKLENKSLLFEYMRAWYADENAIVRHKLRMARVKRFAPLLEEIISQGIKEGVMTTLYPDQAARMMLSLLDDLGDATADLFLTARHSPDELQLGERILAATTDALERVLGLPSGCLQHDWHKELPQWLPSSTEEKEEQSAQPEASNLSQKP